MAQPTNNQASGLEQQMSGLDINSRQQGSGNRGGMTSSGGYQPPHMRNQMGGGRPANQMGGYGGGPMQDSNGGFRYNNMGGMPPQQMGGYGGPPRNSYGNRNFNPYNNGGYNDYNNRGFNNRNNYNNRNNWNSGPNYQDQGNVPDRWARLGDDNKHFNGGYNNSRHQRDGNTHDDRLSKKWDERQGSGDFNGENVDWSKPTAEDENMKQKLFSGSNTGINFGKYEDIPVEATGENVPDHINTFEEGKLGEIIDLNLANCNYTIPTPVQKYAVPIITGKRDLMACAQTGSGKTAAFLLPILSRLYLEGPGESRKATQSFQRGRKKLFPLAVILSPTRELASQIYDEARKFAFRSNVRPCVVYGGADVGAQMRDLDRGCHLLVATPGRLADFLKRGKIGFQFIRHDRFWNRSHKLRLRFRLQAAATQNFDSALSPRSYRVLTTLP